MGNDFRGKFMQPPGLKGTFDGTVYRGYSAYQTAVQHGYVGTEEEWLDSLKGYSPEVDIEQTVDGAIVTVKDESGETTAEIFNGKDGDPGHSPEVTADRTEDGLEVFVDGESVGVINDGYTPQKGVDYFDGDPGATPEITADRSGSDVTIYADGTQIAVIHDGVDGDPGEDGYSPTASVTKSGNVVTISITDKNGTTTQTVSDGKDGDPGEDGDTPVRGVDYWTAADKAEIIQDVLDALPAAEEVGF